MNSSDPAPERPRVIVDYLDDLFVLRASLDEISLEHYDAFLALNDADLEVLAHAVLNAKAKEARRLALINPANEAPARLVQLVSSAVSSIATGWARFNDFAQYELYKRNPPPLYLQDALKRKVANAHPIIERAVRDFMRRQQDAGLECGSSTTEQSA